MGELLAPERRMTAQREDHPVAVAALSRKRAEIAGLIIELEKQIGTRRQDLVHIDNALRLLNSPIPGDAIPARKPRPKNTGYFVHGELTRRIYEGLRDRPDGVSASELADAALRDKGIDDPGVRATFVSRFLVRLSNMVLREHIERIGSGQGVRWRLKR
ncbi:MAG: hypothetical protein JO204_12410 [Alphaproteobacteria bacterium]|nr:hypothetical protein [Alphaproteobacteria bacterium]